MESNLVPMVAASIMAGQPYTVIHSQIRVDGAQQIAFSDNAICILVGHPSEVDIVSDLGNFYHSYGDHVHKGNITIKNHGASPTIITFIRLLPTTQNGI